MAEVLALTASVIAVVQIADRVVDICKFYIESVNDSPSELRVILIEISALRTILENVKFLASCPNEKSTIFGTLSGKENPIEGCRQSICELEKLFPSSLGNSSGPNVTKKRKFNTMLAALAWPLKEKKAKKLLDEILRYKSTITVALTTENTHDIKEIKTSTSHMRKILTDNERQEVFKWLTHTDPSSFHHEARKNYEVGTGDWILRTPEWDDWLESKQRFLWIHGIPGAGKTVLISRLIEQTKEYCEQKDSQPTRKCICVYCYCYFGHNRDETNPLLLWLLNQLCRQADIIPEDVYQMYRRGSQPDLSELLRAVANLLNLFEAVYVIVDAVDESNPREDLLKTLRDFVTDARFQKIQLLASSREYIDIERMLQPISSDVSMANAFVEEDIRKHVGSVLRRNPKFRRWSPDLLTEVEYAVSKGAKGMFRWAVCQIDALQRLKGDISIVRQALKNLPKDLDETYDRVLLRVPEDEQLFVQHALQWIQFYVEVYNESSFSCSLLLQAISKSTTDLDVDLNARYYDAEILQELCGCLVRVVLESKDYGFDDQAPQHSTASFAHFTVQEYLESLRTSKSSSALSVACKENLWRSFTRILFKDAFHVRVEGCWFTEVGADELAEMIKAVENDFGIFSVTSAFRSLRMGRIYRYDDLRSLACDFLNPFKQHFQAMNAILIRLKDPFGFFDTTGINPEFLWDTQWDEEASVTQAIFLYSLSQLIEGYDEQKRVFQSCLEGSNSNPVLYARIKFERLSGYQGLEQVYSFDGPLISLLVGSGTVQLSTLDILLEYSDTFCDPSTLLLDYLARHYHYVDSSAPCPVERLLEAGANSDGPGYNVTPLQVATSRWDFAGVKMLLEAGANPNFTGNDGKHSHNRFDCHRGKSPLHILNQGISLFGFEDRNNGSEIKALLLEYGAEDFSNSLPHEISDVTDDL